MELVRGTCRSRFNAADIDFILRALGKDPANTEALTSLLADAESRDQILDHERLHRSILEQPRCLEISSELYFYVLVRRVFKESGIEDRSLADYVADVLAEFTRTERATARVRGQPVGYFFEMLAALPNLDPRGAFLLRAHMGNSALYFSGLFPERLEHEARRRGRPEVSFFERMGEASFAIAGKDRRAADLGLAAVFKALAAWFHEVRLALNRLADRVLALGDSDPALDRFLLRLSHG